MFGNQRRYLLRGTEGKWLDDKRYTEVTVNLKITCYTVQMGLIYVNPEGPNGFLIR
jgi:catalase (peroxidase I)